MPLIDVHGAALEDSNAVAVQLAPGAKLEEITQHLSEIGRVEIEFPKFRDGRGFTLARTLREHYGYKGDIRATGHFIPDQFPALLACGFTSFVTPPEHDPAQFAAATHARQPGQLLRRMVARARET
jgi:uncharacterized protein (DUF934 family)